MRILRKYVTIATETRLNAQNQVGVFFLGGGCRKKSTLTHGDAGKSQIEVSSLFDHLKMNKNFKKA